MIVKVKVVIFSSDIRESSSDFSIRPGIVTHTFTVLYILGECIAFLAAEAIHKLPNLSLQLVTITNGWQEAVIQRFPRLLHMTSATGNRTPDLLFSDPTL